jgi:hypothetical protein
MHKWAFWEKLTYLFVCWRTSYCASEETFPANRLVVGVVAGKREPKKPGKPHMPRSFAGRCAAEFAARSANQELGET